MTEWGHNGDLSGPAVVAAPVRVISEAAHIDEVPRLTRNQRSVMDWLAEGRDVSLRDLSERLTASCREVDPTSTDEAIQFARAADVVEGEAAP